MKQDSALGAEDVVNMLLELASHAEISDHVPGTIKLRLLWSGLPVLNGIDFDALMNFVPGVLETRVRLLSRRVVIEYDEDRLPYDLWESMGQLKEKPQLAGSLRARLEEVLDAR
ncbi:MAG TPA: hypothetical protein EYP19_04165 [Desulfobacterales bacterium]|nr:hypothetical protein [Desulfobacterales bacterium]